MRITALCGLLTVGCGGYVVSTTPSTEDPGDAASMGGEETDAGQVARQDAGAQDAGVRDSATTSDAGPRDAGTMIDSSVNDAGSLGRSQGCGMSASGDGEFTDETVRVNNTDRSYHVRLPDGYDSSRAYALIFRYHGYGGTGLAGGLGIEDHAGDDAIIVGPDGLNMGWSNGSEAGDLAFFDAMYKSVTERYCVDRAKVFSYGFSMGGGFTNLLGCRRADVLRGTAAIAGFDRGTGTCDKPVAAWFRHGSKDQAVPIAQGTSARDRMITRNGCDTTTTPAGSCVSYQGCDEPVIWCETGDDHNIAGDTAPKAVWDFFRALP